MPFHHFEIVHPNFDSELWSKRCWCLIFVVVLWNRKGGSAWWDLVVPAVWAPSLIGIVRLQWMCAPTEQVRRKWLAALAVILMWTLREPLDASWNPNEVFNTILASKNFHKIFLSQYIFVFHTIFEPLAVELRILGCSKVITGWPVFLPCNNSDFKTLYF